MAAFAFSLAPPRTGAGAPGIMVDSVGPMVGDGSLKMPIPSISRALSVGPSFTTQLKKPQQGPYESQEPQTKGDFF